MHQLKSLKEKLVKEICEYGNRSSFSSSDIQNIKNLISSILKLCEYNEMEDDEEYSNRMSYRHDSAYRRDAMGRYARDNYARRGYSRDDDMMNKLYEVMDEAPEHKKQEIKKMIDRLEQM